MRNNGKPRAARVLFAVRRYLLFFFSLSFVITCCMLLFLHNMAAVSYTHLDVYKRQSQWSRTCLYSLRPRWKTALMKFGRNSCFTTSPQPGAAVTAPCIPLWRRALSRHRGSGCMYPTRRVYFACVKNFFPRDVVNLHKIETLFLCMEKTAALSEGAAVFYNREKAERTQTHDYTDLCHPNGGGRPRLY